MANSVVKVTDAMLNDSLLLLVGEDGTVTPDRETVENYLSSKSGATNIQIMHINKNDSKGIDVSINNVRYLADADNEDIVKAPAELNMDEVARNLYNFRLDHDYTPLTSPKKSPIPEDDELAKTLSILDGDGEAESENISSKLDLPPVLTALKTEAVSNTFTASGKTIKTTPKSLSVKVDSSFTSKSSVKTDADQPARVEPQTPVSTKPRVRTKSTSQKTIKQKSKKLEKNDDDDDEEEDEDFDIEYEDEDNDSDFELEEEIKQKTTKRSMKRRKSESKPSKSPKITLKKEIKQEESKPEPLKVEVKQEVVKEKAIDGVKPPETPTDKKPPVKKEKKTPKPILDDFALFSTPDIIRRVGGKEPTTPDLSPTKPARIQHENRSKSSSENTNPPSKHHRLSVDNKHTNDIKDKHGINQKPLESRLKERRPSVEKTKRTSIDEKSKSTDKHFAEHQKSETIPKRKSVEQMEINTTETEVPPSTINEGTTNIPDFSDDTQNMDQNINLEGTGLDLDPTILENLNNDLISDDILYQVAQSLVANPDIQNAIDKTINESKLDLDSNMQHINVDHNLAKKTSNIQEPQNSDVTQKGTQIVRPDGRIVVIPPIERPTTRSRNKKKDEEKPSLFKPIHKPLDDEHVSGNELDSSGDEEEESEDDPNKLWCICNQPHNNRFMICCDTCEEWYHGKCVNITKAMGQQMESEGKEWICLFCKDPSLRRPQAAARRVRKASRNSRASTDSVDSSKKSDTSGSSTVPCVVCQKPARKNSIFCSEACILVQAHNVERAVVFDRATGNMLSGSKAPSAVNLDQWLKEHPNYEAVKAGGKVVTSKTGQLTQSKLKLVKNTESEGGVSLAVQKRGISVGVLKHAPKNAHQTKLSEKIAGFKIVSKQSSTEQSKTKLVPAKPITSTNTSTVSPKVKVIHTSVKSVKAPPPKEKPVPVKTPKARQQEQQAPQVKQQENIRENVQKTLFEQLTNRLKLVDNLKLSEDEVRNISTEIESQLYKCFGDTGQKYRNKYRSLIFNIKDVKNQTLWRRICEKSINPYELVRLSPDDLASQELAMWREREAKHQLDMIKKSELELLNCNRQYVLKTHKGEQVLEEDRKQDKVDNIDVIKSLTEGSTLDTADSKADSTKDKDKKNSKHSHKDKERDRERKSSRDKEHRSHRSSSRDRDRDKSRKRSRSRDHGSKKDKKRSRSRERDKHRKSHKSSKYKRESGPIETSKLDPKSKEILDKLVVNKIVPPLEDRLWKHVPQEDIVPAVESDSDHEPTSTVTIPTPPRSSETEDFQNTQSSTDKEAEKSKDKSPEDRSTSPPPRKQPAEIWRGTINMIDVAQISISAHEVSGDCQGLGKELASNLDIVGRISPETVWDYISKMKCSNSKIISLVRLNATNIEEKMPYLALYSYLSSRNRLGVVKSTNKAVKDFYILPLASQKPIPQALLPLNGPGFEESRPALLCGIIVRDKRKRPYLDPIINPLPILKRSKLETTTVPSVTTALPPRSYTPPPVKDPRMSKLPLPSIPPTSATTNEEDEPYSPEDSDPDSTIVPIDSSVPSIELASTVKYTEVIPGLGSTPTLPNPLEIERQMEELNKKIEMQKSEINTISENITASAEIKTSALANIALPSNLQQILDSIKTIGAVSTTDSPETTIHEAPTAKSSDLTIPLMIPKSFPKRLTTPPKTIDLTSDTIPLVLPSKPKIKPISVNSPSLDSDKSGSVLSSLSEEDLIRKAAEMLGEGTETKNKRSSNILASPPSIKRPKVDLNLPPVPGVDDEVL